MAFFNSKSSVFQLTDSGGTLRNISPYLRGVSGLPGPRDLNDVTALGDTGRKHIAGLEDVSITLDLMFSNDAAPGIDAVLGGLRGDDTARAFDYGPYGLTGGFTKYSGTMKLEDYSLNSAVGELVTGSATLRVQGVVTRGTY